MELRHSARFIHQKVNVIYNQFLSDSRAINSASDNNAYGGGGIWIRDTTAELTNVTFTEVKAEGSETVTAGGAIGSAASSCKLYEVSFTDCSTPLGSLLFGDSSIAGKPAYTVGRDCTVDNKDIITLPPQDLAPLVYLTNGATITFEP
jgi:hypothetical protein